MKPVSLLGARARGTAPADRCRTMFDLIHYQHREIPDVLDAFNPTPDERKTLGEMLTLGDSLDGPAR